MFKHQHEQSSLWFKLIFGVTILAVAAIGYFLLACICAFIFDFPGWRQTVMNGISTVIGFFVSIYHTLRNKVAENTNALYFLIGYVGILCAAYHLRDTLQQTMTAHHDTIMARITELERQVNQRDFNDN